MKQWIGSTVQLLALLSPQERQTFLTEGARRANVTVEVFTARLAADWSVIGRAKQQPPEDDWTYWFLRAGRGFGKAACVETPVVTPDGWKRLGDIEVGDEVFDESGRPSRVEATYDRDPEVAYRLWFSDGTHIDVCSEHLWTTWQHRDRKALGRSRDAGTTLPSEWPEWRSRGGAGPRVRTTQEIVETLTYGRRGDINHSVPVCGPLDLPDADLPLDPYILGAWLGDGNKYGSQIHSAVEDHSHWYRELAAFAPHPVKDPIIVATFGLHVVLRGMGVLKNKHVPAVYLRASAAQRLALLQGLMDTDGSASPSSVEFSNTNYVLVMAVVELARSLGQKPVIAEGRAMLDGRDCGPKWRVTWRPTTNVFRMERKARIVRPLGSQAIRNQHRMIVYAEQIDPKPMRCLTVASRHHTFLIGEAMIPTHNTLTAAQWAKQMMLRSRVRFALVAPTFADGRDTMVEGETGLLALLPDEALRGGDRSSAWNRSIGELYLANGSRARIFSSDQPDRLRGPQHHYAWCEEVSSWKDAKKGDALETTWSNVKLSTRLGERPQFVITSTPKQNKLTKELSKIPAPRLHLVTGSSYENRENLSEAWWREIIQPYEGTRLGRQEILAELLEDVEGALWSLAQIEALRVAQDALPPLTRIVVAVDPNASDEETSNSAGVIVVGLGSDGLGYVLEDCSIMRGGPRAWAAAAVGAYDRWDADRIVAEKNNGGEMVRLTIQTVDENAPVKLVTASAGKRTRAEPVSSLYEGDEEKGNPSKIRHVGTFPLLEEEMTTWVPGQDSPDRMDALVWGITELFFKKRSSGTLHVPRGRFPVSSAAGFGTNVR